LDKLQNHFVVYYVEPRALVSFYDRQLTGKAVEEHARSSNASRQANAILFEYVAHAEVSSKIPTKNEPKSVQIADTVAEISSLINNANVTSTVSHI